MTDVATEAPGAPADGTGPLLQAEGLVKDFAIRGGVLSRTVGYVSAVAGVDVSVDRGETLGLVGESGCGNSTTGRLLLNLIPPTAGTVLFDGEPINAMKGKRLAEMRRRFQIVFQDPYASLNPRMTVGAVLGEPLKVHFGLKDDEITDRVGDLLRTVGLAPEHTNRFPHEFSGGQRQRIGVARALAVNPKLIVCDEPVSALDVSVQAQILNLLSDLQRDFGLTYVFIAHDLNVVRHSSDRVMVMYLGKVAEVGDKNQLYETPKHPYTGALLSAVPIPNPELGRARKHIVLEGDVPNPINPPSACNFHPRCPRFREGHCDVEPPPLYPFGDGHVAACHYPLEHWPMTEEEMRRPGTPVSSPATTPTP